MNYKKGGAGENVLFLFFFPPQQRGERDSQNQAVLTKLKCAAGTIFSHILYVAHLGLVG